MKTRRSKIPPPEKRCTLDHPKFKVFYKTGSGYTIHTQFFDTVHISQPTELERILLDHLQREILQDLDESALQAEYQLATQDENTTSDP